jgi:hypothetical protein
MINQVIEVCSTDLLKGDWSEKEFKQYLEYDGKSIDSQINDFIILADYLIEECIKTSKDFSQNLKKDFMEELKYQFHKAVLDNQDKKFLDARIDKIFQNPIKNEDHFLLELKTLEKLFLTRKLLEKICLVHSMK